MFLILGAGLSLWVVYGVLRSDWVIVGANTISVAMLSIIVYFRLRGGPSSQTVEKSL
jgi:MtN3 and saliva related transmembrane protein